MSVPHLCCAVLIGLLASSALAVSTPEEFSAYLKSEIPKWAKVLRASGAKPEWERSERTGVRASGPPERASLVRGFGTIVQHERPFVRNDR